MARGGQCFEKLRRCVRTVFFVAALVVSLLVTSLPVLVAVVDVIVPCVLISSFTCVRCYGFKEHLSRYSFKSSLTDIPLVSVIRSFIIICMILFKSLFVCIVMLLNYDTLVAGIPRNYILCFKFYFIIISQNKWFYFIIRCLIWSQGHLFLSLFLLYCIVFRRR